MDLKLIQRLIRLMKGGGVGELELEDREAGLKVRIKRGGDAPAPAPLVHVMQTGSHAPVAPPPMMAQSAAPAAIAAPAPIVGTPIVSPMVGTFYRSSSPDAEPFVKVGAQLEIDAPICIIEAMKVMNEIKAEISGQVLEVLVENGEPVEFGQPLFMVKTT
jgi:acetyl-CoA carboxylase biotin carboxyl carrier protein